MMGCQNPYHSVEINIRGATCANFIAMKNLLIPGQEGCEYIE